MDVVDREENGRALGHRADDRQGRERDRALIRLGARRIRSQQSLLQCVPLRFGQIKDRFVDQSCQQVPEAGICPTGLGLRGSGRQRSPAGPFGHREAFQPERRLPDTG